MSLWADDYQDALEWAIIPFLAYQVIHLSFAELWLASGYTLYVEALGHSGIRAYWPHPLLTPVLKPFGMELAIEDHDLHHRYVYLFERYVLMLTIDCQIRSGWQELWQTN
jgi:hypothetical protein